MKHSIFAAAALSLLIVGALGQDEALRTDFPAPATHQSGRDLTSRLVTVAAILLIAGPFALSMLKARLNRRA